MALFRLPEKHLPMFKALCNETIKHLPSTTENQLPLIGRKLYNPFARALGHKDYNALQYDAKQYGDGAFDWGVFYLQLSRNADLCGALGTSDDYIRSALVQACRVLSDKYAVVESVLLLDAYHDSEFSKVMNIVRNSDNADDFHVINYASDNDASHNITPPGDLQAIVLSNARPYSDHFENELGDVDILDALQQQDNPVIDLSPMHSISDEFDQRTVARQLAKTYCGLPEEKRASVIFTGTTEAVYAFLQHNLEISRLLSGNPSITKHGISTVYARTATKDLSSVSVAEAEAILANSSSKIIMDAGSVTADVKDNTIILPDGSKYPLLKPAPVQRDEYGIWYHPDWPEFDEDTPTYIYESWKLAAQVEFEIKRFEDWASEEQWEEFLWEDLNASGFKEWQPTCDKPGAFLVGIYDTEDGPVATFAVPKQAQNGT